jgi:oxygen-dependent protoporphyrinogen oxidase
VSTQPGSIVVVGGGITGLTAAYRLGQRLPDADITVVESDSRLGGKIRSSPFAGLDGIDEGADAFLTRVPYATALAKDLGLGGDLTSPASGKAFVWWHGLHAIPEGLMLGVPTDLGKLARTKLLSWPGKLRAALEPILPATGVAADSVGRLIRKRFGREVHERLVDPLVGSIYAADTDHFSLTGVPQIFDLASKHRSLLLGARRIRAKAPPVTGPIFATPRAGMSTLTDGLATALERRGAHVRPGTTVTGLERNGGGWRVHVSGESGEATIDADAVLLATPARTTAPLLAELAPTASATLAGFQHVGVVMVAAAIPATEWPRGLSGYSGYLVPKPVQHWVTAVSFGSSKWAHWQPVDDDGQPLVVLRISLGRDGLDVMDQPDDVLLEAALGEVGEHLGITLRPVATRLTKWPMAFPQYRPGHAERVAGIEQALAADAPGVLVAGASYRGIGIPACVQQGERAAETLADFVHSVRH